MSSRFAPYLGLGMFNIGVGARPSVVRRGDAKRVMVKCVGRVTLVFDDESTDDDAPTYDSEDEKFRRQSKRRCQALKEVDETLVCLHCARRFREEKCKKGCWILQGEILTVGELFNPPYAKWAEGKPVLPDPEVDAPYPPFGACPCPEGVCTGRCFIARGVAPRHFSSA